MRSYRSADSSIALVGMQPDVQARAADALQPIVHERHLESQLAGPEGGGIAARAGAEDDDVEGPGFAGHAGTPRTRVGWTGPMVAKGPARPPYTRRAWTNLPLAVGLIVMGYLVGSLPMGVIVARLTGGTDPRTVGSGRTGGTNALRAMGWPRAILVGLLDLAKGAVPILVARAAGAPVEVQALTGVAAVLGAWKSVFLRFHGGRGVATGVGGMLGDLPARRA